MPSESRPALTIQTEKPNHYSYLKEFRVEQCSQFLQHKCTNHRPFTCFHWHFNNQRRRRPVRKRDGSFNYSPDSYCTKYDETTGICPDGDECLLLHRTAGDTERRYHLRYYKTCMCVHDTDSRGFCVKNGPHCAFAHGSNDLRPPVYDVKELQAMENADTDSGLGSNGPNVLDKERNLMNEDPKWQDTAYVLAYYKTEPCKRPPRLCRQGYACPQYHNSRDKRRSPRQFKYRSTPCPSVKHGDEWGETSSCDAGDLCAYCHTRTEQQFHPEIYKSTRCNDVQQSGYCPRGVFCAFAHVDQEMTLSREAPTLLELKTSLADILSNALPPDSANQNNDSREEESSHSSPDDIMNRHLGVNKEMLNQEKEKQEKDKQSIFMSFMNNDSITPLRMNFITSDSHLGTGFFSNDNMDSVLENTFEDLNIEDPLSLAATMDRDLENDSPTVNSISQGIASTVLGSSAPMNIPGGGGLGSRSVLPSFNSPPTSSPLPVIPTSAYMTGNAFQDPLDSGSIFMNHASTKIGSFPSSSGGGGGLYNFSSAHMSPTGGVPTSRTPNPLVSNLASISPSMISNSLSEIQRLREEVKSNRQVFQSWDDRIQQARTACEAWKREAEEANLRANIADQQKEEALSQINLLRQELDKLRGDPLLHALNTTSEAKEMPIHVLQSLQLKLKSDLETINKIITDRSKNNGGPILNSR